MQSLNELYHLITKTPMLGIQLTAFGKSCVIYAKAEFANNITGSIKDRMAWHIIHQAYQTGELKPGMQIVEATSGNTGISFAAMGSALGHTVTILMPDWMSVERKKLILAYRAKLIEVSKDEGGFIGSIKRAEELANRNASVFLPRQFSNTTNTDTHYLTTGREIYDQLLKISKTPNAFIAGVGTGGTIMGVGRFLKEKITEITIHPLEPSNSPTLSSGGEKIGSHRIQGISDEFIPDILKLSDLNEIISVDDGDAILMAQKMAKQLGLGVGISSGANIVGAIKLLSKKSVNSVVVTVLPDDNKKYLSTDLFNYEPVKEDHITPHVELLSFRVIH